MRELDEKIREYASKAGLSSKELATILANKTAVDLYMTFHKSKECLGDACIFGLYSNTYKFNEARKDSKYDEAIEFFDKVWNSEVTLHCAQDKLTLRVYELVNVCESNDYLDKKCKADAKTFLNGGFEEDDFQCLVESIGDPKRVKSTKPDMHSIFKEIISADELRSKLSEKALKREYGRACKEVFDTFDAQVFKGCACCTFVSEEMGITNALREKLEAMHLLVGTEVKDDSVVYTIKPAPTNGDYTGDYSEEELHRLLKSKDGGAYYFVQNYCDKVYVPKLIQRMVKDVTDELHRVLSEESTAKSSVCIAKRKTSTDAYVTLFRILKDKGFRVTEYEDEYEVSWNEKRV